MPTLLPRRTLAAGALAAALLTGAPADAQLRAADAAVTADENAALRYWRAFSLMDAKTTDLLAETYGSLDAAQFDASPELRKAIGDADTVVQELLRGSVMDASDFGVDADLGPMALLSHLQPMRNASRLLLADARLELEAGDQPAAAERIAGAIRMAEHATQDDFVVSSLVGVAMFDAARRVTDRLLDQGALDAEARGRIRAAVDAFPQDDPFRAKAALEREARVMTAWIRDKVATADGRAEMLREITLVTEPGDAAPVQELSDTQAQSHVDLLRAAYGQLIAAWDAPDPQSAVARVSTEVAEGAFGEFARIAIPSIEKFRASVATAEANLAAFRERLAE